MHDLLSAAIEALATAFSGDIGRGLARLKYPIVFLIGFMITRAVGFYAVLTSGDPHHEWQKLVEMNHRFFWGDIAMGFLFVFVAFINSPPPKKPDDSAANQKPESEMTDKTP